MNETASKLPLSVCIITLNEERNLPRCLESVRDWTREIVVIDSGSKDKTAEIAKQFGAIVEFNPWPGFLAQKNIALRRCSQPWALCLDADEVVSPELLRSIRSIFEHGEPQHKGYWINRRTWYLGRWIWHAWYPEWRLRLARTDSGEWRGADVHEQLRVDGTTDKLEGDLLHYPFDSLEDHLHLTLNAAKLTADSYARSGKKFRWRYLLTSPPMAFFKHLVLKQGWRDGWRGWVISMAKMINVAAKYSFLLTRERMDRERDHGA